MPKLMLALGSMFILYGFGTLIFAMVFRMAKQDKKRGDK